MANRLETIYHLHLGVGINSLKLGINRVLVLGQFGLPDLSRDTGFGIKDFYDDRCLQIEYTYEGLCVAILVSPPSRLVYQGIDLLSLTWEQALQWVRNLDPNAETDKYEDEFKSYATQISMSAKLMDDWVVEAVLVFAEDYWPSEKEIRAVIDRERAENPLEEDADAFLERIMNQEFNADMQ
jgi:hypothetical protein